MSLLILHHPSSHDHVTPPGHPERVARIETVMDVLARPDFADLARRLAPAADDAGLALAHDPAYVARVIAAAPSTGWASLDPDTHMSPGSLTAARHAAGACIAAVDAVLDGAARAAFCAVRPCGHHAERDRAMGFCLFNNVAVGARHAVLVRGLSRVAIVDFDVHHGNGTQDIFEADARVFFASSHQMPLYPGTGRMDEIGVGNIVNLPLRPGSGGAEMRQGYERIVLPALRAFKPELVLISAGFDAHVDDPLANLAWQPADFAWLTEQIARVADETAEGRIVSTLEGGYDLDGLAASLEAHLTVLKTHAGSRP